MTAPIPKPGHLRGEYGSQFGDRSVVEAYRFRPPYPDELFDVLISLTSDSPGNVLDAGCGTGPIARRLVDRVDRVDAVDVSEAMIEEGKRLPGGDHPGLRWIIGGMEDAPIEPPYALIVAGQSLHWMEWDVVMPRFLRSLAPGAYLAIVNLKVASTPWREDLLQAIQRYSTNREFQPYDLVDELEMRHLFQKVGEQDTAWVPFTQPVEEYIEAIHSMNGFSRRRMSSHEAEAFDEEARLIVSPFAIKGKVELQTAASIVWGFPHPA
ncbi:MAG TPA: methyltransferase domain-containing protein [Chloroflexia bacterium]|jgi:SAM-dependent methyltransferase|nr:methyltransferase domain-containing protein [Chloroflexia bacterium]